MRKFFCDSCAREIERPIEVSVPCHLYSLRGKSVYVDTDFNMVSGRMDKIDLCAKCLNKGYSAMIDALEIKPANQNREGKV